MPINLILLLIKCHVVYSIIGGCNVQRSEAPFQANYADICGAVIIQQNWALTTAHCGARGTFIRIGSVYRLQGLKIQVQSHTFHPKYQMDHEFDYDIQLLKFYKTLSFDKLVHGLKICDRVCEGEIRVYGWGYLKERGDFNSQLQRATIRLVPVSRCQAVDLSWYNHTLTPRMFCAGGVDQDACQGDSGGPVVASGVLIGISSFGYGCGRHIPGVYTNVSDPGVRDWIRYLTGV